ncbi:hypothetical protein PNOK_0602500 [Pyrrhoderma noxium]|uniref:Uncharacterized protein n=1 Tax=Pyrrhoderma noxium TaxID=2282107 RepID=A0A286UHU7_9AGAM|nr:hypothetical protein PNOK_0602500 [Pyrrhoderma noxium]
MTSSGASPSKCRVLSPGGSSSPEVCTPRARSPGRKHDKCSNLLVGGMDRRMPDILVPLDEMPSHALAETWKYLYLIVRLQ